LNNFSEGNWIIFLKVFREHYKNSLKNLQIYRIFQNKYNL
jgi:hypothetical protein